MARIENLMHAPPHHDHSRIARAGAWKLTTSPISAAAVAANTTPSTRSKKPPCPGISELASLTPNLRFSADSAKSPACAMTPSRSAVHPRVHGTASLTNAANTAPAIALAATPVRSPDQVLLGERRGHSFGPPMRRPPMY